MIKRETQSFDNTYKSMDDKIAFLKLFDLINLQKAGKIGRISQKKMQKRSDAIKAIIAFDLKNKFLISKTMFNNPNEYQKIKTDPNEEFNTIEWNQYLYDNMKTAEWSTIKDDLTAELNAYKKEKKRNQEFENNQQIYDNTNNETNILSESNGIEIIKDKTEKPNVYNQIHDIKLIYNEIKPVHHEYKNTYQEHKPIAIKKIEYSNKNNIEMKEEMKREEVIEENKKNEEKILETNFLNSQKDIINEQLIIINQQKKMIDQYNKFMGSPEQILIEQNKSIYEELKLINKKLEFFEKHINYDTKNKIEETNNDNKPKYNYSSTNKRQFIYPPKKITIETFNIPMIINNKKLSKVSQTSCMDQNLEKKCEPSRDELERFILEREYEIKTKNSERERMKRLSKIIANSRKIAAQQRKTEILKNKNKWMNDLEFLDMDYSSYVQYLNKKFKKNV